MNDPLRLPPVSLVAEPLSGSARLASCGFVERLTIVLRRNYVPAAGDLESIDVVDPSGRLLKHPLEVTLDPLSGIAALDLSVPRALGALPELQVRCGDETLLRLSPHRNAA